MSDVDEITGLVYSYARLLDGGDVDAVSALFEHSTWRSMPPGSVLRGTSQVRPVYERLLAAGGPQTKHLITNLWVALEPKGTTATSHCLWTVVQKAAGGQIEIKLSGQYADTFEKVDDQWRFADRLITTDLSSDPRDPAT